MSEKFTVEQKAQIVIESFPATNIAELYSNSKIQITFSTAERFPLPPLEAMACGCAVITTPYGVEDYVVNGENALLTQPDDIDMLVSNINLLIEDDFLCEKLEKNGLKTAQRFKYSEQAKVLEREIRKARENEFFFKIQREILWKFSPLTPQR